MKPYKNSIFTLMIAAALLIQLMNPTRVYADDGTPPIVPDGAVSETTPPQEPVTGDMPANGEIVIPAEIPATAEPVAPAEVAADTEPTVLESIQEIPAETDIIVLNENGEVIPLATEEAASIIAQADPMWCPKANTTVTSACVNDTTVAGLLTQLASKDEDGVIYFYTPTAYNTNDVTFDGTNTLIDQLADNSLTLQGGWDGTTTLGSAISFSGNSVFSVPISIYWWQGDIAINEIGVGGASGKGVTVETTGDINLHNITVSGNNGYGLEVHSGGNITVDNITASGNTSIGAYLENWFGHGNVILTGTNVFNKNVIGLYVDSRGDISASNITASENIDTGAKLDNSNGSNNTNSSGTLVTVTLTGTNVFNKNGGSGLIVNSSGDITANNITASENAYYGAVLDNTKNASGAVTLTGTNVFNKNGSGLSIYSMGNITLDAISAEDNSGNGVLLFTPGDATINGNIFQNNLLVSVDASAVCGTLRLNNFYSTKDLPVVGDHTYANQSGITTIHCKPKTYLNGKLLGGQALNLVATTVIHVDGVTEFNIDCHDQGVFDARLPNNDRVKIFCPVSGKARISRLDNTTLPADLPAGFNYMSAFSLDIFQGDGTLSYISEGGYVDVSFQAPSLKPGVIYSILYWDNGKWVPLKDFMLDANGEPRSFDLYADDDPRKILSGLNFVLKDDSWHIETSTNFPGIFVLALL